MPIHGTLFQEFREKESKDPFSLQNKKMLSVDMRYGEVMAKTGSMIGYQGDVRFAVKSSGVGRFLKSAMTGEGLSVMTCSGQGDLFLADDNREVQIMYLENDTISVNGNNVLAFSSSINWDIHRIQARGGMMTGGLYNVALSGTGYVAVTTKGDPVALDVASAPTFGDAQAVVLWTAGVRMDVRIDTGGIGSMLRGGSGESLQMAFSGQGYVVIQPSETVVDGSHQTAGGGGNQQGGILGGLL